MRRRLLEKAIAIDPNYGQALGVLAASHIFSAHMGWADMAAAVTIAERAALAAIQADSEDPWAHYALGSVHLFTRRFDDSLAEFELALQLNPDFSLAQGYYGLALSYCGRWEEADLAARRALRLSPRDPFSGDLLRHRRLCAVCRTQLQEAMRLAREALRQRSDFVGGHRVLTAARHGRDRTRWPRPPCRNFAALSPISRWPGSRTRCRSSATPTASTIWKASAGPGWSSCRALGRCHVEGGRRAR